MVPITDRTVRVSLVAQVSQYVAGMAKAERATKDTGAEAEKLAQKKEAFERLGVAVAAMGAVAAAGVVVAIKKFADWDAQMSQVQSLSHATAAEMNQLRDASLNMGQAIGFSATQVADAETELVKAGVSVKDILGGGLVGALNLAAAGQIDVAQATEIAGVALTQFKLAGKDVPHVADLLAAGADKALGGVQQLGQALNQSGLVANQFGLSIDETVGTLSAFANAGLLGSDAGTSFKQMLLSLASPSSQAADTMRQYNIQAYDAQGNFVGISSLAGQLKDNFRGVSDAQRDAALSTIFGSDAIRTANVLYQEGSEGIQKWTKSVNDQGFAAQQASGKMDNLNGDLKKLGAAFDTAIIKSGSGANDVLRTLVKGLTDTLHWVGELPQPVLTTGLVLTGLAAAIGLVGGGALIAVPKVAQFKVALETLGVAGPKAAASMTAVGAAMRAVPWIAVMAYAAQLGSSFVTTAKQALGLEQSVDSLTDKLSKGLNKKTIDSQLNATVAGVKTNIDGLGQLTNTGWLSGAIKSSEDFISTLQDWNPVFKTVGAGTGETTRKVKDLDQSLANMVKAGNTKEAAENFDYLKTKTDGSKEALQKLKDLFPEYAKAQKDAKSATDDSTDSASTAATAYQAEFDRASELTDQISQLTDQINKANGVGQDAVSSNAAYQDALQKVKDTIDKVKDGTKGYSDSLDTNTSAGADNVAMFADLAAKSQDAAKAQFDVDNNSEAYIANLKKGRQTLIDNIVALGGTADQASAIADQVYRIPSEKAVKVLADTAQAKRDVDLFKAALNTIDRTVTVHQRFVQDNLPVPIARASGGILPGAPSRKDNMLIHAASGEFIVNALATAQNRGLLEYINAGGRVPGFANGGQVQMVRGGSAASAPTVNVAAPSMAGMVLSARIDGFAEPVRIMIDGAIRQDKARDSRRQRMG